VNLWKTEIYYDSVGGAPHPPRDTEWGYPAKIPASAAPASTQSGEEELTIGGRLFHTRWQFTRSKLREVQLMRQCGTLPPDMQAARNRLVGEIQTVMGVMTRNDVVQANHHLQTIQDTLAEIEKYLGR
jgi:hypothetical protein